MARRGRPPRNPPLSISHPELISEWHPDNRLTPDDVTKGSEINILWRCNTCQNEWNSLVYNRIKSGCSACTGKRVHSDGRNSLATLRPDLATEWHSDNELSANEVLPRSHKKFRWVCRACSHCWEASTGNRSRPKGGTGCPACAGKVVHIDGRNSLAVLNPDLAAEWHPDNDLLPSEVRPGANRDVKWKCKDCRHVWNCKVAVRKRSGCPSCWDKRRGSLRGSLSENRPDIALDWHPENSISPDEVAVSSNNKFQWRCHKCVHEWTTSPNSRDNNDTGCPACSGHAVHIDGSNSLAAINPELVEEWAPTNELSPTEILPNKFEMANWICKKCQHEWEALISARNHLGSGCPACDGRVLHADRRNSLAKMNPELAKEWHRNNSFGPETVTPNSNISPLWMCSECEHEWKAKLSNRNRGSGCPACEGYVVHTDGRNSLATLKPDLAAEWHSDNHLSPEEVTSSAFQTAKWQCNSCGNEWFAGIYSRRHGGGCAACAPVGFNPEKPAFYYCFAIHGPKDIWWYKGGISNDYERRGYEIQRSLNKNKMQLELELLEVVEFKLGADAEELEKRLLKVKGIRSYTVEKFSGKTELFNSNPLDWARKKGWL